MGAINPISAKTILTARPQPAVKFYGINELDLLGILSVADASAGGIPNLNDPTKPVKNWADANAVTPDTQPGDVYFAKTLKVVTDKVTGVSQMVLPPVFVQLKNPDGSPLLASDAGAINLPAPVVYPAWVTAPTAAVETVTFEGGGTAVVNTVNPADLATEAQAQALMAAVGGNNLRVYAPSPGPGNIQINYSGETRQMYVFVDSNNQLQYAGRMLIQQYAQTVNNNVVTGGVGAPGKWVNFAPGTPDASWRWVPVPAATPFPAGAPLVGMPVRSLYSNEEWDVASAGQAVMIQRTDLPFSTVSLTEKKQ